MTLNEVVEWIKAMAEDDEIMEANVYIQPPAPDEGNESEGDSDDEDHRLH